MELGKMFGKKGAVVISNAISVFEKTKLELEAGVELLDVEAAEAQKKREVVIEKRTVEDTVYETAMQSNTDCKTKARKMIEKIGTFLD